MHVSAIFAASVVALLVGSLAADAQNLNFPHASRDCGRRGW